MFIVISYLDSGSNSCMGCTMESWDSDLIFSEWDTKEEAADFIASEEARQAKIHKANNTQNTREYAVINGEFIHWQEDVISAKEMLDILLKESTI